MKSSFLFFVRHGETEWNAERRLMGKTDSLLTERGKRQSKAVAELLRYYTIDVIYSSPLTRTLIVAKAIRKGRESVPLIVADELQERNFGLLEGKNYDEAATFAEPMQYGRSKFYPWFQPPEGERLLDVETRAKRFARKLKKYRGKNIVIVSHGSFLRVLYCTLLGIKLSEMGDIHFENASLSIIELEENQPGRLHALNITSHLSED